MDDVNRRQAIRLAAAGSVTAGVGVVGGDEAEAQDRNQPPKPPIIREDTPKVTIDDERVAFIGLANGTLVKGIGYTPVWMVINGVRHGYTSRALFDSVHKRGAGIYTLADVDAIPEGAPFSPDLELIKAPGNVPVFLLNNGRKRGFTSRQIFERYQYDYQKIHEYSAGMVAAVPEDPPLPG